MWSICSVANVFWLNMGCLYDNFLVFLFSFQISILHMICLLFYFGNLLLKVVSCISFRCFTCRRIYNHEGILNLMFMFPLTIYNINVITVSIILLIIDDLNQLIFLIYRYDIIHSITGSYNWYTDKSILRSPSLLPF